MTPNDPSPIFLPTRKCTPITFDELLPEWELEWCAAVADILGVVIGAKMAGEGRGGTGSSGEGGSRRMSG